MKELDGWIKFMNVMSIIALVLMAVLVVGICASAKEVSEQPRHEETYHVIIKTDNVVVKEWEMPYEVYSDSSGYTFVGADGSSIHFK